MMKKFFLFFLVLFFSFQVFAQQGTDGQTVERGKIFITDSQVIEGQYIVLSEDSVEYYMKNIKERKILNLNEVNEIQSYNGHYGNTGIWIGGIGGGAIGVVVALGTKETKRTGFIEETTIQTWPIYVFTAVGTLVGYVIGSSVEDWETVYSKDVSAILKNVYVNQNEFGGMSLTYTFHF
jgi:hypothetical protein